MRRRVSPALTALVLTLFMAPAPFSLRAQETPEAARGLMEDADRAREGNRIDEAIARYRKVIDLAPSLASAYINLGALYFQKGKIAEAYDVFVRGLSGAPTDRTLLMNAAAAAQQLGKSSEALRYVDAALEKSPRDAALLSLRASVLRALNRNDDALAAITTATQIAPEEAKYQFSRGNLLVALARNDEAIAAFRKATELDPKLLRAYYNLGAVLFEAGRYDEALEAYQVALAPIDQAFAKHQSVEVIHARAYANLGAIHLKQKKWAEAIDAYQKAASLDDSPTAHYNLGFLFFTTGKIERAQDEYRKALASDAALPLAYLHLGTIAFRASRYEEAVKWFHDGMPHFDHDSKPAALRLMGRAQLARGDRTSARTSLEEAVALDANDGESLLLLARMARHDGRFDEARSLLDRAYVVLPSNAVVVMERVLVARATNDLATENAALETLLARQPGNVALRNELAVVHARQSPSAATLRALPLTNADLTAVLDALDGKRDEASRTLAKSTSPLARGDAGILLWESGRNSEALPLLDAAHKTFPAWNEVTLAAGDIALAARRYGDALELFGAMRCDAQDQKSPVEGSSLEVTLGAPVDVCTRARALMTGALLSEAAAVLEQAVRRDDETSARRVRQLADRVTTADARARSMALFLRGTADLVAGSESSARDALTKALAGDLPPAVETAARRNLLTAQTTDEAPQVELSAPQPRLTVVVFLPDTPAETEKKLAEGATAIVNNLASSSSLPLKAELFRRADDARAFLARNRDSVGVVLANPEFLSGELVPRYSFCREGRTTYRRVVVVPSRSPAKSLADLRGKTISGVEALGNDGVEVTHHVADDLTALANALYGRTDAALVSESNPLLADHARELRVVHTSSLQPMPVAAFAPMPAAERSALDEAFHALSRNALSSLQMTGVVRTGIEPRKVVKRDIQTVPATALGLRNEAPVALPLRVSLDLPRVEIPEDLFGSP